MLAPRATLQDASMEQSPVYDSRESFGMFLINLYFDMSSQAPILTLAAHTGSVSAVVFSPTSADTLYSGGWDHSVRVWDIENHVNVTTKVCRMESAIDVILFMKLVAHEVVLNLVFSFPLVMCFRTVKKSSTPWTFLNTLVSWLRAMQILSSVYGILGPKIHQW